MYLISAEGYKNANSAFLTIKTTNEIWVSMTDTGSGIGVKVSKFIFANKNKEKHERTKVKNTIRFD